jgi:hypothetical protein
MARAAHNVVYQNAFNEKIEEGATAHGQIDECGSPPTLADAYTRLS